MSLRMWLGWIVSLTVISFTVLFFTFVENFWVGNDIFYLYVDYGLLILWYIVNSEEEDFINFENLCAIIASIIFIIILWPLILNYIVGENSAAITRFLYKPIPGLKNYHDKHGI